MGLMSPHLSHLKPRCLIQGKHVGSFLATREMETSFIYFFQITFSLEVSLLTRKVLLNREH